MTSSVGNILGKAITAVTKPDSLKPIIALEATVVTGRTYQAYKRGGIEEARERVIEETSGSVVWLGGVKLFNWIGDKIIGGILGNKGKGANVDTGHDALRKPFNNFTNSKIFNPKNFSDKAISRMKFAKVATSILAANAIIGFVVPNFNHKLTNSFKKKDKNHIVPQIHFGDTYAQQQTRFDNFKDRISQKNDEKQQKGNVPFKGGLNVFTNFVENTNTGQLLSTDLGVLGGRSYNARKPEEKTEVIIRDGGSIYFYMWAQDHVRAGLNKIESNRWSRLDPNTTSTLHNHLETLFENDNAELSVDVFKEKVFGKDTKDLDLEKFFGKDRKVITLQEFNAVETNPEIQARALEMSTLQPKQLNNSVLSREQVTSIYQQGEINNPKLLKSSFEGYTKKAASSNPNKFVSESTLTGLKDRMKNYVNDVCKAANKNGGKVNKKLLNNMKKKNLMWNGVNFAAGFAVAALFLSTLIPKFQYWVTKKVTGVNAFPGTYEYDQQQKANALKK